MSASIVARGVLGDFRRASSVYWSVAIFVVVWTLYHALAQASTIVDHDSAEAYAWGREFQLGYYKHPPFWAWITGVWFLIFPRSDWAFALLNTSNAAIGLLGVLRLNERFSDRHTAIVATLMLAFTPFYTILNDRFGGNTIFLSLWPWTAYAFVASVNSRSIRIAALFGALAALDMLSKYYAVLLLFVCFAALPFHRDWKSYARSSAPWVALLVFAVLVAPHVIWLFSNGFLPFRYFDKQSGKALSVSIGQIMSLIGWCFGSLIPVLLIVSALSRFAGRLNLRKRLQPEMAFLSIMTLAPFVLTVLFAFIFRVHISERTGVGVFCLVPLFLLQFVKLDSLDRSTKILRRGALAFGVIAALVSPVLAYENMAKSVKSNRAEILEPKIELAEEVTLIWNERTGHPLKYVTGPVPLAESVMFYSTDSPSELVDFNFALSPWVSEKSLRKSGLVIVCPADDSGCRVNAKRFSTPRTKIEVLSLRHVFAGIFGPYRSYAVSFVPPE